MLVSVTERTREIGGAQGHRRTAPPTPGAILIEAGYAQRGRRVSASLGSGISLLLRYGLKMSAVLSFFWIATALILCGLIGIVFASILREKPRDSTLSNLRYE